MEAERFLMPDGSRFRIWGVNMAGVSPFPDKEHAERIADDLARLGINCVRFHGLDSAWGRSIIDYSRNDTLHEDPVNFDRFDWLVYQLKQRGIYSNLNLNVFRVYKAGDAVRDFRPLYFGKSATYYNPRLLELQRDFAHLLLEHHNPYTGNEYRHEPAVFCVEMVNENSVLEGWVNGRLIGEDVGAAQYLVADSRIVRRGIDRSLQPVAARKRLCRDARDDSRGSGRWPRRAASSGFAPTSSPLLRRNGSLPRPSSISRWRKGSSR